jgi:hypothetical protein
MSTNRDYIPRGLAQFNEWYNLINFFKQVTFVQDNPWTHIPDEENSAFIAAFNDWTAAYTLGPGNIREVIIHFWIEGADHRAKPDGYDGAVVIWDIADAPFTQIEDLKLGYEIALPTSPSQLVKLATRGGYAGSGVRF